MKTYLNKTTYIIIGATLLVVGIGVMFFSKGSLTIESSAPTIKAKLDSTEITIVSNQPINIQAGFHTINIASGFYDNDTTSIFIFPWSQKTVFLTLNPNKEGKTLLTKGSLLTKLSADFTITKDSRVYLDSIKKYLTNDAYDSLNFQLEDSLQSQNTTAPTDMPKVFLPTSGSYLEDSNDGALVTISITKTKDELSVNNIQFVFTKTADTWLVTNIIYN